MSLDPSLVAAGTLVGFVVGLTGMGGGALLTPLLVLVFRVPPLAAVSSDLVASLVMKPFGGAVHLRHGTVLRPLLGWLVLGSVPSAFAGSVLIGTLAHSGHADSVQAALKVVIALALLGSVASTAARVWLDARARRVDGTGDAGSSDAGPNDADPEIRIRPGRTVAIGALGGLAVGLTSVGAGTLIIALLLLTYPRLRPRQLVGTDLVQAIPLVASAALGHLLFGEVQLTLTVPLLVGAIPAVLVGARLSASTNGAFVRPVVAAVLFASALALLSVPPPALVGGALVAAASVVLPGRLTRPSRWVPAPEGA